MTYAQFARLLGVSPQAIQRYLNGTRFPKPRIAKKICELTQGYVSLNDLYDLQDISISMQDIKRGS